MRLSLARSSGDIALDSIDINAFILAPDDAVGISEYQKLDIEAKCIMHALAAASLLHRLQTQLHIVLLKPPRGEPPDILLRGCPRLFVRVQSS